MNTLQHKEMTAAKVFQYQETKQRTIVYILDASLLWDEELLTKVKTTLAQNNWKILAWISRITPYADYVPVCIYVQNSLLIAKYMMHKLELVLEK